ncbi:MAG: peptidoglycan DD-metalloendopeptidase family protein [Acidobacteriota bacterium]|nr:peptidoglycan DD-metalloendopeptidase family protein [Acidobacteriota bacterium]
MHACRSLALAALTAMVLLPPAVPVLGRESPPPAESREQLELEVRRGDTLAVLLGRAGLDPRASAEVVRAIRPWLSPSELRPGQRLSFEWSPGSPPRLARLAVATGFGRHIEVLARGEGIFAARQVEHPLVSAPRWAAGRIGVSLYASARAAGVPPATLSRMIRALSFDVDFQREIRRGDRFTVLWEEVTDLATGRRRPGALLAAGLMLSDREHRLYRFTGGEGGRDEFFDAEGRSARRTLMRTPIDGARLSSSFGRRRHPVLGYSRMHRGLDFAAPPGTPIYAAGDGRVVAAGWNGSYGRYIRLRHNSVYETAYAHLRAIARGVRVGARVRQGQVIGFVGSTGRVTGPHLHYEVLVDRRQVHPLRVELPAGRRLAGAELEAFRRHLQRMEISRAAAAHRSRCRLR